MKVLKLQERLDRIEKEIQEMKAHLLSLDSRTIGMVRLGGS